MNDDELWSLLNDRDSLDHQELSQDILQRIGNVEACHADVVNGVDLKFQIHSSVCIVEVTNYFVKAPEDHPVYH